MTRWILRKHCVYFLDALYAMHFCGVGGGGKLNLGEHTWMRNRKNEIKRGTRTCYSLKHFLLFLGNSTQKCGNPLLEVMLWKQGRGGRRGITAFSLSLRDHNDDKESITVLHWRYVHSWGDSQSAGCPGLPLHSPPLLGTIWGVALCQLLEKNSIDGFWQRSCIRRQYIR